MYKPGQIVPESGLYTVIHDPKHRERHEITCVKGHRFPPCNQCGDNVRFRLRTAAQHVKDHISFR